MKKLFFVFIALVVAIDASAMLKVLGETISESGTAPITLPYISTGTAKYYPNEKRLVFNNVTFSSENTSSLIETDISGLSIEFTGPNEFELRGEILKSTSPNVTISGQGHGNTTLKYTRNGNDHPSFCGIVSNCADASITIKDINLDLFTDKTSCLIYSGNTTATLTLSGVSGHIQGSSGSSFLYSLIHGFADVYLANCAFKSGDLLKFFYDNDVEGGYGELCEFHHESGAGNQILRKGSVRLEYGATPPTLYPLRYQGNIRINSYNAADIFNDGTAEYNPYENRLYLRNVNKAPINAHFIDYFGTDAFSIKIMGGNVIKNSGSSTTWHILNSRKAGVPCTIMGDSYLQDTLECRNKGNVIKVNGPLYIKNGTFEFKSGSKKAISGPGASSGSVIRVSDAELMASSDSETQVIEEFRSLQLSGCHVTDPYFDWTSSLSGDTRRIQIAVPDLNITLRPSSNYYSSGGKDYLRSNSFAMLPSVMNIGKYKYIGKLRLKVYKVGSGTDVYAQAETDMVLSPNNEWVDFDISVDGLEYGNTYYGKFYSTCGDGEVLLYPTNSFELPAPGFESYNVKVNGTTLTTENCQKGGVVEGVSYNNSTKTLTMENVALTRSSSTAFIYTTDDITVRLIGDNTVSGMNFLSAADGASVTLDGGGTATLTSVGYTSGSLSTFSFINGSDCTIRNMANISVTCASGSSNRPFTGKSGVTTLKLINSTGEFKHKGYSYNDVVRQIKGLVLENVNLTNDTYSASKTSYGRSGKFTFEKIGALLGDIDGNGLIEVNDVVLLADIAMGGSMGDVQMSIADMDGNGIIEVNDVVVLAEIAMGS